MKIVVSIPVELSVAVEDYAEKKGIARSEVYTQAVKQFLELGTAKGYQRRFNEVYSGVTSARELRKSTNSSHETGRIAQVKREIASGKQLTGSDLKFAIEKGIAESHQSANSTVSDASNNSTDPMLTATAIATLMRNEW